MKTRKLASVQYIHGISTIEGADKIEVAHVLGWKCVVNKNTFKVGDLCIYFEVDSFLPVEDIFEFLRKSSYRNSEILGEGFLIKTIKLRGVISQGLVLPLSILPSGNYNIGDDVTEILGVRKWEVEERVTNAGTIIADFPSFISKTDELRVQAFPELIDEFKKAGQYYISTKMDGTSVTVYLKDGHFGVCSRNNEFADDGKYAPWEYMKNHNVYQKMIELGYNNIVIQGEFCGAGIQGNRLKLTKPEFYVFTAVDLETGLRLSLHGLKQLCNSIGLKHVPIEEVKYEFEYNSVEELIERAKGQYASGNNKEGIVIRPVSHTYSKILDGPLSMKVINNDYLLKLKD